MKLILSELPDTLRHYTGKPVPRWMRVLEPHAAASIVKLEAEEPGFSFTDLWRSPEVSLLARSTKQGVQPPGFSAHGYGLSIDFDIDGTLKAKKIDYPRLCAILGERGWFCHRRDGKLGSESWHFNYFGDQSAKYLGLTDVKRPGTWEKAVEARIQELYGDQMKLSPQDVQSDLKTLKMYAGEIDGIFGPISRQAISAFQRAWGIKVTGEADERTQRTLAFVCATKEIVPIP